MRLWSIHPRYLDGQGLVALWRESLLAKKVLENKTKGYGNHPQLLRFKLTDSPLKYINTYLYYIYKEAEKRNYNFDKSKFKYYKLKKIPITSGQLNYEFLHLLKKLKKRNYFLYKTLQNTKKLKPHPLFKIIKGYIEYWEKI